MTILQSLRKARLLLSGVKLNKLQLSNKSVIQFDGDTLEKGSSVYLEDASGETLLAGDGSYKLFNGGEFVIKEGLVESVSNVPAPVVPTSPVPQAQSAATEEVKVKAADEAAPTDIKSLLDSLATALAPIQASLNEVLNVLPGLCMMSDQVKATEKMAKETQTALAKTIQIVEKIAEEPAVPVKMSIDKPVTAKPFGNAEATKDLQKSWLNSK